MPLMAKEMSAGGNARFIVQMITVAPSISIIAGSLVAGMVLRRVGFRGVMIPAILLYAVAGLAGLVPMPATWLVATRILLGLASGLCGTICLTLAADLENRQAARLLGFANATAATTAIGSFIFGGWLAREFGWRLANAAYGLPLLLLPVVLAYRSQTRSGASHTPDQVGKLSDPPHFPLWSVVPVFLVTLAFYPLVYSSSTEGPFLLYSKGLHDPKLIGIAISGSAGACALVGLNYGRINVWLDRPAQFLLVFTCFTASAIVASAASTPFLAAIGLSLMGCGSGILSPLLLSTIMQRVPRDRVAEATSGYVSATYLSLFASPSAYAALVYFTPLQVFPALAAVGALGILATVLLSRAGLVARR